MINYEVIDPTWITGHKLNEENVSVIGNRLRSLADYLFKYCPPDQVAITVYKQGSDVRINFNDDVCSYEEARHYSEGRYRNYGNQHKYRY